MLTAAELPTLDLRAAAAPDRAQAVALQRWGSCLVQGHALTQELQARAFAAARAFFALPTAEKRALAVPPPPCARGWVGLPEGDGEYRESFFAAFGLPEDAASPVPGRQPWPAALPELEPILAEVAAAVLATAVPLLRAILAAAGAEVQDLSGAFAPPGGVGVRILHYPPLPPERRHNLSPHTDLPPLALIAQDGVDGVEWRPRDDEAAAWSPVRPRDGALILQLGDTMARWSNDRLAANLHRVVNRNAVERVSIACFLLPAAPTPIRALPGTVAPGTPARHAEISFGQLLRDWQMALDGGKGEHIYRA